MSGKNDENARRQHHQDGYAGSPTTQQMRTVGQRRRDAEEKLEHHLDETRRRNDLGQDSAADEAETGPLDSQDVVAIQNDDRLSAADRVDLIPNRVVTSDEDAGPTSDHNNAP